jgi:hypothetical protein
MSEWISVRDGLPDISCRVKIKGFEDAFNQIPFEEVAHFIKQTLNHKGYFSTCFDWKRATHWAHIDPLNSPMPSKK